MRALIPGTKVIIRKKGDRGWNNGGKMDQYIGTTQIIKSSYLDTQRFINYYFEEDDNKIGINSWYWREEQHFDVSKPKIKIKLNLNGKSETSSR